VASLEAGPGPSLEGPRMTNRRNNQVGTSQASHRVTRCIAEAVRAEVGQQVHRTVRVSVSRQQDATLVWTMLWRLDVLAIK